MVRACGVRVSESVRVCECSSRQQQQQLSLSLPSTLSRMLANSTGELGEGGQPQKISVKETERIALSVDNLACLISLKRANE